jgi:hypothetical protein
MLQDSGWGSGLSLNPAGVRVMGKERPAGSKRFGLATLKVHKNENFFGFDFEFCTISLLVMSKY